MPFGTPTNLDRFIPVLAGIRKDLNAGAKAGVPGCTFVILTTIVGAILLVYQFSWDPGWHSNPANLLGLATFAAAVWAVWKAGGWWATPADAVAERASRRLDTDVLQPLVAELRRGARYESRAEAPARTLERSHLVRHAPFTSANQIRWRAGDLDLEMFEIESLGMSSDSPSRDRYFVGLLAWADVPEDAGGLHVSVRSRHEFWSGVEGPQESAALDGFAINDAYRVVSNWEPFARAMCTPALMAALSRLASEGTWVHVAVADGRAWVGIETEPGSWFRRYPRFSFPLLGALDNAHVAALERQLGIIEELTTELARAVRAQRPVGESH